MNLAEVRKQLACYITSPIVSLLGKTRITPDALTCINLAFSIAAAYVIATDRLLLGGILVLVSGLFDLLDGALARFAKRSTDFGAVLDSTVDRISEATVLGGLLVWYLVHGSNLEVVLVFAVLVGSFLVSYIRARAEGIGQQCQVGLFTRAERVVVLALGLLLNQVFISLCILLVFVSVTTIQRLVFVREQTRIRGAK